MKVFLTINIDFDGTCVKHAFPLIGDDIGAVPVLKKLVERGHQLILFTMRSNNLVETPDGIKQQNYLSDAIDWFKKNDIPLYGVQTNPTQKFWTSSPKSYAEMMIDDSALGCPLKWDTVEINGKLTNVGRPYVDWVKVEEMLTERGLI
jgi:hypothetical protein